MAEQTISLVSGQVIAGKYMIERQIGAGGMGVVAVATHLTLGQRVAIKFLNEAALESTDTIARFEREAKACVQLRSEHVARVSDVGVLENGAPYMVMEYLEGQDLASVLESGTTVPFGAAVDYVLQACEAIAEAHRLGIVHRDLKPANLFLTRHVDGRPLVKVLDFGISKVTTDSIQDTKLTSTTAIIGSPSYMSPEQLRASRDVDHRGDVWALGVILFELLTNTLPFESTNVMELCMKVASEPVPRAESRRADLPPGLGDVVARCLEKDPARRYQSISELVYALEPYQDVELSTTGERIRRVQGGAPMQSSPSSPPTSPSSPPGGSSARVLVHGGTSVSWGKTEASILPPPPQPKPASAGPWIALAAVALLVVGGGGAGGAVLYMKHKATLAAQPELPLPKDRTALPPLGGTAGAPPLPASSLPGSVDPGAAVNPMPDDRAPLSPASLTSAQVAPQSSQSAAPVASAGTKRPPPSGLGARPRPGGATTKPGAGGDDALPDARK